MKDRILLTLAVLALLFAGCAATRLSPGPDIVGTWRLVEYWNRDAADQPKTYPYGEQPLGFIIYDRAGNVLVQIAKNPQRPRVAKEDFARMTVEELRAMLQEYVAYFGTYTVDAAHGVVIHHVAADLRREYTATDQRRTFQLSGDELIIGDSRTWLRRFVRIR
jgi:hypothetical protein